MIYFREKINKQMSLSIGVAKIFATDVSSLSKQLRSGQKRGVSFDSMFFEAFADDSVSKSMFYL